MKFSIYKSTLLPPLERAAAVAAKRTHFHATSRILFEAIPETAGRSAVLRIDANNLESSYRTEIACETAEAGTLSLDARQVLDIVKSWPSEVVRMDETEPRWVEIASPDDAVRFHLVGGDPEEHPDPETSDGPGAEIPADELSRAIAAACLITAPADDNRPHVAGIAMDWTRRVPKDEQDRAPLVRDPDAPELSIQSTDSARLSVGYVPCPNDPVAAGNFPWIVPKSAAQYLARLLSDRPGNARLSIGDRTISVEIDGETWGARLHEGEFPATAAMVATGLPQSVEINAPKLMDAARRMSIMTSEKYRGTIWRFDGGLEISATNPDMGESRERLAVPYDGEAVEAGMDARFIEAALKGCAAPVVRIEFENGDRPFRFTSPDGAGRYVHLVMPMKL